MDGCGNQVPRADVRLRSAPEVPVSTA